MNSPREGSSAQFESLGTLENQGQDASTFSFSSKDLSASLKWELGEVLFMKASKTAKLST